MEDNKSYHSSTISVVYPDGYVKAIYCHWDGDLDWVGRTLLSYFNSNEKVIELVSLGDISSLGTDIDLKSGTVAYYRDRARDRKVTYATFSSLEKYSLLFPQEQFNYLWIDNRWLVTYFPRHAMCTPYVMRYFVDLEREIFVSALKGVL